jgi:hypothetical protein
MSDIELKIKKLRDKKDHLNELNRNSYKKRTEAGTNKNLIPKELQKKKGRKTKPILIEEVLKISSVKKPTIKPKTTKKPITTKKTPKTK